MSDRSPIFHTHNTGEGSIMNTSNSRSDQHLETPVNKTRANIPSRACFFVSTDIGGLSYIRLVELQESDLKASCKWSAAYENEAVLSC